MMPGEMVARSRLTGIELDPLTASIARHLYPDAEVWRRDLKPRGW